jgi:xylulokinase
MAMVADVSTRAYWQEMLSAAGIDGGKLPAIVDSGAVIGEVVRDDLPIRRGVRVVAGANDQTANAIGAGLDGPQKVVLVLGTALIGFRLLPGTTLPSDEGYHGICSVYPVAGTLYQLGFTNTGCGALDWARGVLAESVSYEMIFDRIATIPIGCEGVTMLIDLDGLGWPSNPNYRGSWAGLSRKTDRWTMLRATIEGICFSQRELIESMRWDLRGKTVRAVGGAMRSPIWAQMLCDVLGVPLERLGHEQSGVVGAAMMAAVGAGAFADYAEATSRVVKVAGRYEPDAERHAAYQRAYDRYVHLRRAMQTFYV